ncbi:MAG: hypothetical protein KKA07_11430 [Bacteroidetes bacterium]|nr:hypothetical protein [Bacteroidota bacterium]MBU1719671.1 hypothetical protein [Bacteroidota bacterium]
MNQIDDFVAFIKANDGIGNKSKLSTLAIKKFNFIKDRTVFYTDSFAVRFSFSSSGSFSNTVLSLSKLQKFDHIPFLICLITEEENRIFVANSTFLVKISHSSQTLTQQNIKGSFNGSDICKTFEGIENNRDNILQLFAIHAEIGFQGNLLRLVEATTNISPTGKKFEVGEKEKLNIIKSIDRAIEFCQKPEFEILRQELDDKVEKFQNEILIASHIENVNIRGRIIEYLIAGDNEKLKSQLVIDINEEYNKLPGFKTDNTLGDYVRIFENHHTETDVKTKLVLLNSNPKAYYIDKFLEYHNKENTVFFFYFIGINAKQIFSKKLISVYQENLIGSTILLKHWAGRNYRGVTQFVGTTIQNLLEHPNNNINKEKSVDFLNRLFSL